MYGWETESGGGRKITENCEKKPLQKKIILTIFIEFCRKIFIVFITKNRKKRLTCEMIEAD